VHPLESNLSRSLNLSLSPALGMPKPEKDEDKEERERVAGEDDSTPHCSSPLLVTLHS
jgi:hypothetical protein